MSSTTRHVLLVFALLNTLKESLVMNGLMTAAKRQERVYCGVSKTCQLCWLSRAYACCSSAYACDNSPPQKVMIPVII